MTAALRRLALRAAVAGASSALAAGLAAAAAATVFARRIVTPDGLRPEDVEIIAVVDGLVTLRADPVTTLLIGRYGLWQDNGTVHARLGPVIVHDPNAGTVLRRVLFLEGGRLRPGPARWNQYFFAGDPLSALGLEFQDIEVPGEAGVLHGWLVPGAPLVQPVGTTPAGPAPGAPSSTGSTWAILVHGRGATREECLRALPVLHRLGVTSLVASYRTTAGLPTAPVVGRYHLGDTEWQDVESAIIYAAEQGAEEIVLIGWSMGGAIAMQAVSRSWTAERVKGIVLDAPVLDWRDVLAHQARLNRVPPAVGRLGQSMLSHRSAWRLAGTEAPVDLDRLDWVTRAAELIHPVLLIHSDDDEYVPSGPSRRLAEARPDLVTYLSIDGARHCKEWNVDPDAWDSAVARFLLRL
ncbi:MAG TPA: alpha/beta fold hydrolase [Kineosporiaceae bacterium]|nr:alpha/beta fold hydrolase [Kineosporiaceae bacterium]